MSKKKFIQNATLEEARIGFRNFSGKEGKFNKEGDRNFVIFLESVVAEQMAEDGWNIKWLEPRDDQDDKQAFIKVKVNFRNRPPRIFIVTSKNKTPIGEDMVDMIDWIDIDFSDVIITPYHYEVNGRSGVAAYLKAIYVNIHEDDLHTKYEAVPDSAQSSVLQLESGDDIIDAEIVEENPFGDPLEIEE